MDAKKQDITLGDYDLTDLYNNRINKAYDLDMDDVALDPGAVKTWLKMIIENGLNPGEVLPKARAKYDPKTRDLFLSVPLIGKEGNEQRHLVFVLQNDFWQVNTHDCVIQ